MSKGEVFISEGLCLSCGYCVAFCPKGCVEISEDKIGPRGYQMPIFINPEKCNACGICGWLCPHSAIEVYAYTEEKANAVKGR